MALGGFALIYKFFVVLLVYYGKRDFCGSLSRLIQSVFVIQGLGSEVLINMCTHLYQSSNCIYQCFLGKQNHHVCVCVCVHVCKEIYLKELAHTLTETGKSKNMQGGPVSWRAQEEPLLHFKATAVAFPLTGSG